MSRLPFRMLILSNILRFFQYHFKCQVSWFSFRISCIQQPKSFVTWRYSFLNVYVTSLSSSSFYPKAVTFSSDIARKKSEPTKFVQRVMWKYEHVPHAPIPTTLLHKVMSNCETFLVSFVLRGHRLMPRKWGNEKILEDPTRY